MIIVENGTIVAGANSYVTEAELADYATARGMTITPGDEELYLIEATDYLETLNFIGDKVSKDQPLQWPRYHVYIDDWHYPDTEIPKELKNAQLVIALSMSQGNSPMANITAAVKRVKADVVEVEFADGAVVNTVVPAISASLKKLIRGYNNGWSFKVYRGGF